MIRRRHAFTLLTALAYGVFCFAYPKPQSPSNRAVLYEGARLIAGDGSAPIESSAILVENGAITRIGSKGTIGTPRGASRIDLTGKTIMPALVNAHGHP